MTTVWTCDIDENEVEERCSNNATYIVTWFDEADEEQNRAGKTLKVCSEHRREVRAGVLETPAVVAVAVARIDWTVEDEPSRPTQWCWPHLNRGEFVRADTLAGLDETGHVTAYVATDPATQYGFCDDCVTERTREA